MTLLYIWLCGIPVVYVGLVAYDRCKGDYDNIPAAIALLLAGIWPCAIPAAPFWALHRLGLWLGDKCKERKP